MAFRRVISVAAAAVMVLVGSLFLSFLLSPNGALAQEGDAAIVVEQAHPANNSVHYFVKLAADGGDGAPIDGATVTATPTSPDGAAGQPVELQADGDGIYQGSVQLSENGDWTVTFASTDPQATLSWDQTMPGEPFEADDGGSDSSPVFPLLFAAAFLITLAGMGVWALMDRRRNQDGEGPRGEDVVADPGIDDAADAHLDEDASLRENDDDADAAAPRSAAD